MTGHPDFSSASWRKSTTSGDGGCVEVARSAGYVGVRDTKANGEGATLVFNEREWRAFLEGAQAGEFDFDALG